MLNLSIFGVFSVIDGERKSTNPAEPTSKMLSSNP